LDENTADYRAYLGYAIYRQKGEQDQSEPTLALRYLSKALELDAHLPDAYLFLGHIHWDLGQDKHAERDYEEVLYYEPDNIEALQQLRLIFANRQAALAENRWTDNIRRNCRTIRRTSRPSLPKFKHWTTFPFSGWSRTSTIRN
jgi:tetratricopeptide (TPR) repeat protein